MSLRNLGMAALAIGCILSKPVVAQVTPDALKIGLPGDTTDVMPAMRGSRLVTFRYTPDASFAIRALQDTFVNIEVPEGELIQGLYLSDSTQWSYHVAGDNRRVLIKPLASGLVNTGSLITDKRSYELTMISVPMGQMWFQRVRWQVPNQGMGNDGLYWRGQATGAVAGTPQAAAVAPSIADVDPAKLNFRYRTAKGGKVAHAPSAVFDDGARTWFRFDNVQDYPAIFARNGNDLEVLDYSIQGAYVVVPLIANSFVLRLGKSEVVVEKKG